MIFIVKDEHEQSKDMVSYFVRSQLNEVYYEDHKSVVTILVTITFFKGSRYNSNRSLKK